MSTLRTILSLILPGQQPFPALLSYDEMLKLSDEEWNNLTAPTTNIKIRLYISCEDYMTVDVYPEHPMLIPFYDCEVECIEPVDKDIIGVWLLIRDYMPALVGKLKGTTESEAAVSTNTEHEY